MNPTHPADEEAMAAEAREVWTAIVAEGLADPYAHRIRAYCPRLGRWLQDDPAGYVVEGVDRYECAAVAPQGGGGAAGG